MTTFVAVRVFPSSGRANRGHEILASTARDVNKTPGLFAASAAVRRLEIRIYAIERKSGNRLCAMQVDDNPLAVIVARCTPEICHGERDVRMCMRACGYKLIFPSTNATLITREALVPSYPVMEQAMISQRIPCVMALSRQQSVTLRNDFVSLPFRVQQRATTLLGTAAAAAAQAELASIRQERKQLEKSAMNLQPVDSRCHPSNERHTFKRAD